jgi:3-dehydroquinate synthase
MRKVTVNASKTYDIFVGAGLAFRTGEIIRGVSGGQAACVVTDDIVDGLYAERLEKALKQADYRVVKYVIPNGEASKNGGRLLALLDFLAVSKLSRTDLVIALGGGVVGDLAGFAAAVYMRGVRFVQMPTTLLSAVDSSVGGKTAINLTAGKNLAGAFYQPDVVICDVSLLDTLPDEVYKDGCAEVIKHGMIADEAMFNMLQKPINEQYEDIIARNVKIKSDIVADDEFERGSRKLLNFGHTAGHAAELLSGYKVTHGSAVALGMAIETRAAHGMGLCGKDCVDGLLEMLNLYGLPSELSGIGLGYGAQALADACLSDKKRDGGKITLVFPTKIGNCVLKEVSVDELVNIMKMGLGAD